ncbi:MAG: hypothetical protein DIU78_022315, partial [Pseudomonadota bacterium]
MAGRSLGAGSSGWFEAARASVRSANQEALGLAPSEAERAVCSPGGFEAAHASVVFGTSQEA